MRHLTLLLAAALVLGASGTSFAAPALDAAGKCRDGGKFVKAELCKTPAATPGGKCRDIKTKKFAKCGGPGVEPVPAKKP